jgi:quinol monooxygenase YgiN
MRSGRYHCKPDLLDHYPLGKIRAIAAHARLTKADQTALLCVAMSGIGAQSELEETHMLSIRRCLAWFASAVAGPAGLALAIAAMAASDASAQAGPDAIYTVTTFDVAPSATAQSIALLKQYRDAARKQPGNLGVDLLQEAGAPYRFAIHESWSNRSGYDANEKAAHRAALRDGLKPLAGAPLDERAYRPLNVAPARDVGGSGSAVFMVLFLDVFPPGLVPTLAAVKDVAAAARKAEGNLRYDIEQSTRGGNHMTFYAAWRSRGDFDAYEMSTYARHFRDIVGPLLGSPYDDRIYGLLD